MESRLSLDKEIDIPLSLIDPAPWQPKEVISGIYRRGLNESLDYFGIRDRLKLCPHPKLKGRYILLDGHQRIDVISEHILNLKIREHFALDDSTSDAAFSRVKQSPDNQKEIDKLRRTLPVTMIPCQVISQLNFHESLSITDAKLFTLTFNRNQSKHNEVKTSEVYREIVTERLKSISEDRRKMIEGRLKSMVRPELPLVVPPAKPKESDNEHSSKNQPEFQFAQPGMFTPTSDEPWGATPPAPVRSSTSSHQFVPMVFSLTSEGYKDISNSILRSRSRVFREAKLKQALEKLELICNAQTSSLDDAIDSVLVETALLLLNKRIESIDQNLNTKETETDEE